MSRLLPMLDEIIQAPSAIRAHFRRTGLYPDVGNPSPSELLEPTAQVGVAWAGSADPSVLRRLVLAHATGELLPQQVGLYPAEIEAEPDTGFVGVRTATAA